MCGFAGIVDPTAGPRREDLEALGSKLVQGVVHRGPDDSGLWVDEQNGVVLAHQRLAIIDLSQHGAQPMRSDDGRFVLAYNGEIYNYRELRPCLESHYPFRSQTDTEVLLAGISVWGLDKTLDRLNGMFAFALWDRLEQTVTLVRDRVGEKPLYYGRFGPALVFGSELSALRAHPNFRSELDHEALALYLRFQYIPQPYSIYRHVKKLPSGSKLVIPAARPESAALHTYWSVSDVARRGMREPWPHGADAAVEHFGQLLSDSVKRRLHADVPVGAFLSGGIDSTTVVAMAQQHSASAVRTFTMGFDDPSYDEAAQAARIARCLGTEHTELYVSPADAASAIPRLPKVFDEPFADTSQLPTLLVAELARREVKVALSGDGGDEVFGGYNRYRWAHSFARPVWRVPSPLRRGAGAIVRSASWERVESVFGTLNPVLPGVLRQRNPGDKVQKVADSLEAVSAPDLWLRLMSHWGDPSLLLSVPAPEPRLDQLTPPDGLGGPVAQMMYLDSVLYLPDNNLMKVDRATMSVGLEARVPLLDHRLVEQAWTLPVDVLLHGGQLKSVLRRILSPLVPDELMAGPKSGFGVPIGAWLRGPLRPWADGLLDPDRLRRHGLLRFDPIQRAWSEHLAGRRNWQHRLWTVLMFQAWFEEHCDG